MEGERMKTIRRRAQIYAGRHPAIFSTYYRLKREDRVVQPTTQLVIEGYPRSANTFAVWAFRQAQHEEVRLAHHLHHPAQVIQAARWKVPALVLIREPKDAVISWVVRDPQPVDLALRHYISFYETVAYYRDAYVLGSFEEVTADYGVVIERLNDRFGTHFSVFHHTEENVKRVFSRIEERHKDRNRGMLSETRIARPSAAKSENRRKVNPELESPKNRKLLAEARAVFDYLTPTDQPPTTPAGGGNGSYPARKSFQIRDRVGLDTEWGQRKSV
jgi:hypothetical protein